MIASKLGEWSYEGMPVGMRLRPAGPAPWIAADQPR
jgi:hypothetical protein